MKKALRGYLKVYLNNKIVHLGVNFSLMIVLAAISGA